MHIYILVTHSLISLTEYGNDIFEIIEILSFSDMKRRFVNSMITWELSCIEKSLKCYKVAHNSWCDIHQRMLGSIRNIKGSLNTDGQGNAAILGILGATASLLLTPLAWSGLPGAVSSFIQTGFSAGSVIFH